MHNEDSGMVIPVSSARVSSRIPLVLFTGGMDSTLMLQMALHKGNCDTLYVETGQYPNAREREVKAQVHILEALKGAPYHVLRQHTVIAPVIHCSKNDHMAHATRLLMAALTVVDPHRHCSVMLGGTRMDTIVINRDKLIFAWRGLTNITKWKPVPLETPLAHSSKHDVLTSLPSTLLSKVWVCEHPDTKRCDVCAPCVELANTLANYQRITGVGFSKTILTNK